MATSLSPGLQALIAQVDEAARRCETAALYAIEIYCKAEAALATEAPSKPLQQFLQEPTQGYFKQHDAVKVYRKYVRNHAKYMAIEAHWPNMTRGAMADTFSEAAVFSSNFVDALLQLAPVVAFDVAYAQLCRTAAARRTSSISRPGLNKSQAWCPSDVITVVAEFREEWLREIKATWGTSDEQLRDSFDAKALERLEFVSQLRLLSTLASFERACQITAQIRGLDEDGASRPRAGRRVRWASSIIKDAIAVAQDEGSNGKPSESMLLSPPLTSSSRRKYEEDHQLPTAEDQDQDHAADQQPPGDAAVFDHVGSRKATRFPSKATTIANLKKRSCHVTADDAREVTSGSPKRIKATPEVSSNNVQTDGFYKSRRSETPEFEIGRAMTGARAKGGFLSDEMSDLGSGPDTNGALDGDWSDDDDEVNFIPDEALAVPSMETQQVISDVAPRIEMNDSMQDQGARANASHAPRLLSIADKRMPENSTDGEMIDLTRTGDEKDAARDAIIGRINNLLTARKTLQGNAWLSTSVIAFIFEVLHHPKLFIVDPSYIQPEKPVALCLDPHPLKLHAQSHVVVPLHHNLPWKHWTVAVINLESGLIEHFDSLHSEGGPVQHTAEAVLLHLCKERLSNRQSDPRWTFSTIDCEQQKNGYDCGIYSIINGLCCATQTAPPSHIRGYFWRQLFWDLLSEEAVRIAKSAEDAADGFGKGCLVSIYADERNSNSVGKLQEQRGELERRVKVVLEDINKIGGAGSIVDFVATRLSEFCDCLQWCKAELSNVQCAYNLLQSSRRYLVRQRNQACTQWHQETRNFASDYGIAMTQVQNMPEPFRQRCIIMIEAEFGKREGSLWWKNPGRNLIPQDSILLIAAFEEISLEYIETLQESLVKLLAINARA